MDFTKEQLDAINSEGENIIVSAGAGSGKTAVLTARVIRKLNDGVPVNKLLVLTFTNEAASEMKSRIRKAIIKNKLSDQLDLLDSSYITTYDSYALSLVKKYHYLLNISSNIKIINDGVITIYKYQMLDQIFDNMYGFCKFDKLINDFCLKDDKMMKDFIIEISNKLDLLTNKEEYLKGYIDNNYSDYYLDKVINEYFDLIRHKISELRSLYDEFTSYANDSLLSKLDNYYKPLFSGSTYNDYVLFKTMPSVRFTGVSEEGLTVKDNLKKVTTDILELLHFNSFDEIKMSLLTTKEYITVIIDIIGKLDTLVREYKDKHNVYEFNDISHMANRIVRDNLDIRNEIKEYFKEIMVDEYQDTSSIQEEFINYIANNNLYMVGDIKQSIYRFRNANPYIFRDKYEAYSKGNGGIKIDLLKNFRSRKETLNNINEIFNIIMDDDIGDANYIKDHNMVYGNTIYDCEDSGHDNNMEIYDYEMTLEDQFTKEEKELFIIADDIKEKIKNRYQILDKDTNKLRDLKYSDICIITDRNKYLVTYKKILEYNEIPSVIYMDQELTNDVVIMVIKNLIQLVYFVNNKIYNDKFRYVFTSVMRSFIYSYSDNTIFNILNDKSYQDNEIIKICQEIDINQPLSSLICDILDKFNVYRALTILNNMEENILRIDNLINVFNDLSNLGYSLIDCIEYLDNISKFEMSIKYSSGTNSSNAIKIMNIHKSKGLEFSLCYFTGMHNKFTIRDISSKFLISDKYGIILPYINANELCNTILRDLYVNDYYIKEISEKIRLFYVALTRSREKMIILANLDDGNMGYTHLVPYNIRLKWHSFLDIIKSLNMIDSYTIKKVGKYTKEYRKIKLKDIVKYDKMEDIDKHELTIDYNLITNNKYAKDSHKLFDITELKKMNAGTKIHEIFEYDDFFNPKSMYVKKLISLLPSNFNKVYHEYEFKYNYQLTEYHGIIDLIVEYDDDIYIIDYKLKNISDSEYLKQLAGYKDYLRMITTKKIKTYLYSVVDNKLMEV